MPEDFEKVDDLKVERSRESRRIHPRENPDCLIVSQHPSTPSAHPQHTLSMLARDKCPVELGLKVYHPYAETIVPAPRRRTGLRHEVAWISNQAIIHLEGQSIA